MLNFAGCGQCGDKNGLTIVNRQTSEDEDGEETITYQRMYISKAIWVLKDFNNTRNIPLKQAQLFAILKVF